jgi:hypothetical protein
MTQLDIVEMIGDLLTQIDMAVARLAPSDPNAAELTALRRELDQQQQQLVKQAFDENTAQFQQAAEALKAVNDEIAGSIQKIDQIATVIDGVNRFLTSATNLVTTVAKLV